MAKSVKTVPPEVWAKWGAQPMTREEVRAEKAIIDGIRKANGGYVRDAS